MIKKWNNLDEAVAFAISFAFMVYTYDDIALYDNYERCPHCPKKVQIKDFLAPKRNCKKEFAILSSLDYGVSISIKEQLIENFDISENDFRPVKTKAGEIVYYQITPQHIMKPIASVNPWEPHPQCSICGSVWHTTKEMENGKGEEYYHITEEALADLKDINVTYERLECFYPLNIVSRRVFDYLIERYPRIRFKPLFLKRNTGDVSVCSN